MSLNANKPKNGKLTKEEFARRAIARNRYIKHLDPADLKKNEKSMSSLDVKIRLYQDD